MDTEAFEHHLTSPQGFGQVPEGAVTVAADGGSCCDRLTFSLSTDGRRITGAGFTSHGCGATTAAGSAAVTLVRGASLLAAARVGTAHISQELGGLSPAKLHAAALAADALGRALGSAARRSGALSPAERGSRTLVAMSGGVDSSVAALLCARGGAAGSRGGEVVAVTLELWSDPENDAERSCCSASAVSGARALAHSMGLPHFTLDLRSEFRAGVVAPFIDAHRQGETPNPCVLCNGHVRLDAMLALADRLGCETLATGHYARLAETDHPGGPLLRTAADPAKDQSYMLAALAPESLARLCFPLGELTKPQVRALAAEAGLPVAAKVDSQDLCFLAGTTRERFLERHGELGEEPGEIIDQTGHVLGEHRGQHSFTVGQRRGLGLAAGDPLYVLEKDVARRRVTVGPRSALDVRQVALRDVHLRRRGGRVDSVKLRYRQRPLPARLPGDPAPGRHATGELELGMPADGAAPGQLACLMEGELVLGWGTISGRRSRRS